MKRLLAGSVLSTLLLWPLLAYANDREVKYTLLLIGGIGGIVVGAGLYALLMLLAAAFLRRKALLVGAMVGCVAIFVFSEYTSVQTLRVALGLRESPAAAPGPVAFTFWWQLGLVLLLGFGWAVFRYALRLWQKRRRRILRQPNSPQKPR